MFSSVPKIVFFDWNKTLSYSRFWEQLEDEKHPLHEEGKKISKFLFRDNRSVLTAWMRGDKTAEEVLDFVSKGTGIPKSILEEELANSCRNMKFSFKELPEMIVSLKKRGVRCVIATDNMDTFRKYTIPGMRLQELFDDFLVSCDLRTLKFDVDQKNKKISFFDSFLSKENISYKQVVLFDDCVDDGFYSSRGFRIMQVTSPDHLRHHLEELIRTETGLLSFLRSNFRKHVSSLSYSPISSGALKMIRKRLV